ncbi:hypothetical protein LMG26845_05917 [Achromobacter insuavis]|uniref:NAD-specific glutamate dehydrogenase n=1 Tax=Achromobacter insuavis TaxID=1287735 RepID=A0A6J5BQG3_9BURK|nr:hypothetical protein LMG26845_05917 [Achromobacter insuavis]
MLAVAAAVGLAEGLENQFLLVGRHADAGVLHGERQHVARRARDLERHGALLGELEGVGQQVLQHLAQPLRIGVQRRRHVGGDVQFQRQALVLRDRPQRIQQPFQRRRDGHGLDFHGGLAGLDLGQVEDVVDQRQQVAARFVDGLRVLDLVRAQVARLVLGQQLGQDQRRIQRGAQLVAHVGQELALVLAGLRQQPRLVGQRALHPQQLLGLALQADVGLLELGLLHFHARLRFLQDAALLLQLFVADAQLFLLGLQFFRLALGLGQQRFEARAVQAGADRGGQHFGGAFQQAAFALADGVVEAQLDHGIDPLVLHGGRQDQFGRVGAAGGRGDLEVAGRHIAQVQQLARAGGLPDQSLRGGNLLRQALGRQGVAAKQFKVVAAVGDDVAGADAGVQVVRQVVQRALADLVQAMVAAQAQAQAREAGRDPGLARLGAVFADGHAGRRQDQRQQQQRSAPGIEGRGGRGRRPGLAFLLDLAQLARVQVGDQVAQAVHRILAGVGAHHRHGAFHVAGLAHFDGLAQFGQFLLGDAGDVVDDAALCRIAGRRFLYHLETLFDQRHRPQVRLQVGGVARQQIAALADLGILERRVEQAELAHRLGGAVHGLDRAGPRLRRTHVDEGDEQGGQRRHHEAGDQGARKGVAAGGLLRIRHENGLRFRGKGGARGGDGVDDYRDAL